MEETLCEPSTPSPTLAVTSRAVAPRTGRRRAARPAHPRAETTVSAAILTDRGLAEGYVALPLARLMASRVWASVETLNQQLTLLEHHSFTRMTSDPTFEAQGKALQQLLRAYAALTIQVADVAQHLAQNRLSEADRLALATGLLALLLPEAPSTPASTRTEPPRETAPTTDPEDTPDTRPVLESDMPAQTDPELVSAPLLLPHVSSMEAS